MCNCGNKRNEFASQRSFKINNPRSIQVNQNETRTVSFEYIGNNALTVIGNVTRKQYRYNKKGEVLPIDHHDSFAMTSVNILKRIG